MNPHTESKLVNADITPCGVATVTIDLGKFSVKHNFVVVDHLHVSTPVILGCDFLISHGYVLDFEQCTFYCSKIPKGALLLQPAQTTPLHMITIDDEYPQAIPKGTSTRLAHRPSYPH